MMVSWRSCPTRRRMQSQNQSQTQLLSSGLLSMIGPAQRAESSPRVLRERRNGRLVVRKPSESRASGVPFSTLDILDRTRASSVQALSWPLSERHPGSSYNVVHPSVLKVGTCIKTALSRCCRPRLAKKTSAKHAHPSSPALPTISLAPPSIKAYSPTPLLARRFARQKSPRATHIQDPPCRIPDVIPIGELFQHLCQTPLSPRAPFAQASSGFKDVQANMINICIREHHLRSGCIPT